MSFFVVLLTLVHLPSICKHFKMPRFIPVSIIHHDWNYFAYLFLVEDECKLDTLKAIYSTASPLKPESFEFCYEHIKSDMVLGSITGGTDICSLFGCHNTALPVYRGEIQCLGLGMKIEAWKDSSKYKDRYIKMYVCLTGPCY